MKVHKSYTITDELVEACKKFPANRSAILSLAIANAHKDAASLSRALMRRLEATEVGSTGGLAQVNVSFDEEIVQKLNELALKSQLPADQVLRLAVEAYVKKQ